MGLQASQCFPALVLLQFSFCLIVKFPAPTGDECPAVPAQICACGGTGAPGKVLGSRGLNDPTLQLGLQLRCAALICAKLCFAVLSCLCCASLCCATLLGCSWLCLAAPGCVVLRCVGLCSFHACLQGGDGSITSRTKRKKKNSDRVPSTFEEKWRGHRESGARIKLTGQIHATDAYGLRTTVASVRR